MAGQVARPATPVDDHGADRAGGDGATSSLPVQAPTIASSSQPQGKLISDECKSINASTKGFETSVRKLLKCNAKVGKGKADLPFFAQDTTGTRYPAGMPFSGLLPPQCKERDWVFMVTIPVGAARRSVLRMSKCLRSSSQRYEVSHLRRISGKNAPQPCARRRLNATSTQRDWRKRRIAFWRSASSQNTEACSTASTRNCAPSRHVQRTKRRTSSKRWRS